MANLLKKNEVLTKRLKKTELKYKELKHNEEAKNMTKDLFDVDEKVVYYKTLQREARRTINQSNRVNALYLILLFML